MAAVDFNKRALLTGAGTGDQRLPIRPPWSVPDPLFTDKCSRCHLCVDACETQVLIVGRGGFPEIQFNQNECTFCGQCAQVCETHVINPELIPEVWSVKATLSDGCMAERGVSCQLCRDSCEVEAISFNWHEAPVRGVPVPRIDAALCTGCGACARPCPSQAIEVQPTEQTTQFLGKRKAVSE